MPKNSYKNKKYNASDNRKISHSIEEESDPRNKVRKSCACQGQLHGVIENCLHCGRITCKNEGPGPCFFCGNTVPTENLEKQEQDFPEMESFQKYKNDLLRAELHKEKLLQYDQEIAKNKNIFDEQADWYNIAEDIWQTKDIRKKAIDNMLQEKKEIEEDESKIHLQFESFEKGFTERKVEFDYSKSKAQAQNFVQNEEETEGSKVKKRKESVEGDTKLDTQGQQIYDQIKSDYIQKVSKEVPANKVTAHNKYIDHDDEYSKEFQEFIKAKTEKIPNDINFYDEELFPIESDLGNCLSMHQPWASLVIEGFKRFEGRFWTTEYKGPLWIHAGSKVPEPEIIRGVESMYEALYRDCPEKPKLPARYPIGSLLGMIDFQDVLNKETYKNKVPPKQREENDSEFLFVFRNPRKLIYPIKMLGNKNIFRIEDELKQTAQKSLRPVKTSWFPYIAKDFANNN